LRAGTHRDASIPSVASKFSLAPTMVIPRSGMRVDHRHDFEAAASKRAVRTHYAFCELAYRTEPEVWQGYASGWPQEQQER